MLKGEAPESLIDSYCSERRAAAAENILNSTRSTDFITPKFPASRTFRDATLSLARDFPFARALINSGRLSVPTSQAGSPLDPRILMTTKVLGISGSLRRGSYNAALLRAATQLMPKGSAIDVASRSLAATITVGASPEGIAVTACGAPLGPVTPVVPVTPVGPAPDALVAAPRFTG